MVPTKSPPEKPSTVVLDLDDVGDDLHMSPFDSGQLLGGFTQMASQSLGALVMPQVNLGFIRQMAVMQEQMAETHRRMVEAIRIPNGIFDSLRKSLTIAAGVTPKLSLMIAEARPLISAIPIATAVVVEERSAIVTELEAPTSFNFGYTILINGRFEYRGRQLQNLYHTSKQGKLLIMLLEFPEHYVSNEAIKAKLGNFEPVKGIPNLMAELKRRLQMDGLEVEVTRRWSEGYQLKSVKSR